MTALGLAVLGAGVVLLWAGIKGEDVRELVLDTFTRAGGSPGRRAEGAVRGAADVVTGAVGAVADAAGTAAYQPQRPRRYAPPAGQPSAYPGVPEPR